MWRRRDPCLLRVLVLCVLGLCSFVLDVWCACVAFVYIVRPSHANVVDITGFVVHMCMVKPMPAARAHAVRA